MKFKVLLEEKTSSDLFDIPVGEISPYEEEATEPSSGLPGYWP